MYTVAQSPDAEKNLRRMVSAIRESLTDAPTETAALANASAFMMAYLQGLNWAGFYVMTAGRLTVGPFQGMPACTEIAVGDGVCGAAVEQKAIVLVEDVHAFPGHIACDSASNSELVVPIFVKDALWGVIDLDSPDFGRFTGLEARYFEELAALLGAWLEGKHA